MSEKKSEINPEMLEARRAMAQSKNANFNPGYNLEVTETEARAARETRDSILNEIAACLREGLPPEDERVLALVARYRFEFIDKYLYLSTPIIILGLSATIAALPENRRAYEAYQTGLAEYLAAAFRAYYDTCCKKD